MCLELYNAAAASAKHGNGLPMLLFGSCALLITSGQFSQTTTLGFAAFGAGLCLAAANIDSGGEVTGSRLTKTPVNVSDLKDKRRGCSAYALTLRQNGPIGDNTSKSPVDKD